MRWNIQRSAPKSARPRARKHAQTTRSLAQAAQNRITRFAHFALRVARSPMHRLGVFAAQDIPARKRVIEYLGRKINRRQLQAAFQKRWALRSPTAFYFMRLDRVWALDPASAGSGAEYINHSCDPNLDLFKIAGRIWLLSKRKIAEGEELSYDYRLQRETIRVKCRCGSAKCRGTINLA